MARFRVAVVQLILSILLLALPLVLQAQSCLVDDADEDRVADSSDAFPTDPEAALDTDHDGLPDSLLGGAWQESFEDGIKPASWIESNNPGGSAVTIPSSGAYSGSLFLRMDCVNPSSFNSKTCELKKTFLLEDARELVFYMKSQSSNYIGSFYIDGIRMLDSDSLTSNWFRFSYPLSAGTHTLRWYVDLPPAYSGGYRKVIFDIDAFRLGQTSLEVDLDDDNDGVPDYQDLIPPDDTDSDGVANDQDPDDDNDCVLDASDNCSTNVNEDQLDTDADAQGDACDADDDNDGVADASDKFSLNAAASSDSDSDTYPGSWNAACDAICQANSGLLLDNCPSIANPDQNDRDADGIGDVCDKQSQSITVTTPAPASAGYNSSFTVAATANSGLPVAITVSGSCVISGSTITINSSSGYCYVDYSQSGNDDYFATSTSGATTATKASQNITVTQAAPSSAAYQSSFTVAATASSGLPVVITVGGICGISGSTVTMSSGTGTCTVNYNQSGNGNYNAATQVSSSTAATVLPQTLTITQAPPASASYNSSFNVSATSSAGLPVTKFVSGSCTILNQNSPVSTVTMTSGTGQCRLQYVSFASASYGTATSPYYYTVATKASQIITVTQPAPSSASDNTSFTVAAIANSGLPVAVAASGSCSISGNTVTMIAASGNCTINYSQSGDGNYNAATQVSSVTVATDDADGDGLPDSGDNCPAVTNTDQLNTDGDAQGNACDLDDDNDGSPDVMDPLPLQSKFNVNANYRGVKISDSASVP